MKGKKGKTPIKWGEPEIIEWPHTEGVTAFYINRETAEGEITIMVPEATDGYSRTVRRHELLHSQHDRPTTLEEANDTTSMRFQSHSGDTAYQAVADAFVHMVYWHKGEDETADKEAIAMAFRDVQRMVDDIASRAETWNEAKTLLITLRSVAVVKHLGTTEDKLHMSVLMLKLYEQPTINAIGKILQLVKQEKRSDAEAAFHTLAEAETKQRGKSSEDETNGVKKGILNLVGMLGRGLGR